MFFPCLPSNLPSATLGGSPSTFVSADPFPSFALFSCLRQLAAWLWPLAGGGVLSLPPSFVSSVFPFSPVPSGFACASEAETPISAITFAVLPLPFSSAILGGLFRGIESRGVRSIVPVVASGSVPLLSVPLQSAAGASPPTFASVAESVSADPFPLFPSALPSATGCIGRSTSALASGAGVLSVTGANGWDFVSAGGAEPSISETAFPSLPLRFPSPILGSSRSTLPTGG
mmetsp:Transcript_19213/g.30859  ORF Transcript_19213/g.30859 Transcript_19213/m.30859 type:complete len:231 (+) Transcript_19213:312-1004(+)